MKKRIAVLMFCAMPICVIAQAATISVPTDQPTIQAAIDYELSGDVIEVAPGTYSESIDFLGKAITLRSVNGPGMSNLCVEERRLYC